MRSFGSCQTQACILVHMRALRNTGNPKVSPILLQMAKLDSKSDRKVAIGAMKALFALPTRAVFDTIGGNLKSQLFALTSDKSRASTVKGLAAEMLVLQDPASNLQHVLKLLQAEKAEYRKLMLNRFQDMSDYNPQVREAFRLDHSLEVPWAFKF